MAREEPEKGDKVSWNWGGGAPGGTVAEKKHDGPVEIKSKRGNTIKKKGEPNNPAVHIERSGNDVVKKASELTVEEKGSKDKQPKAAQNGKRKASGDDAEDKGSARSGSDDDGPHTENEEGKEVKKGGKKANKVQKSKQDDVKNQPSDEGEEDEEQTGEDPDDKQQDQKNAPKTKTTGSDDKKEANGKKKPGRPPKNDSSDKTKKQPAPRKDGDMVSTRTRSQNKTE
ncbi:hypothetical protein F5Y15DRAFT_174357 [Xylariaceae sp. FL0016]|nr:hypothetical protein F5Y15DRAFT_174357 [Xylariaceae sp. FL0016]